MQKTIYFFMILVTLLFISCSDRVEDEGGISDESILHYKDNKYPKTIQLKDAKDPQKFSAPKPKRGQTTVDKNLNTKTTQVPKPDDVRSHYPKIQSWNSDMSLLRIGHRIYDAKTYKETAVTKGKNRDEVFAELCYQKGDSIRWSNDKNESNVFYLTRTVPIDQNIPTFIKGIIKGDKADCTTHLHSFKGYERVHMTLEEGNIDNNNQYVTMLGKKLNDSKVYVILYDIPKNKIVWEKELKLYDNGWSIRDGILLPQHLDWVTVSPSGKYIVANTSHKYDQSDNRKGIYVYKNSLNKDEALENPVQLSYINAQNKRVPAQPEHGDLGIDSNGNEVWVQFVMGDGIYMFDLAKPKEAGKQIVDKKIHNGGHIGCRNTKRLGWCYIAPYNHRYGYIFALKLQALKETKNNAEKENVELFSQTYLKSNRRYDVVYAGTSPDGTKVIFSELYEYGKDKKGRSYPKYNTFVAEVK